jgi:hypothetical protein
MEGSEQIDDLSSEKYSSIGPVVCNYGYPTVSSCYSRSSIQEDAFGRCVSANGSWRIGRGEDVGSV